jgi:hypothetical protein
VADTVTEVDAGPRKVARQVLVHAPAAEVFALVANPYRHPELDGSGTVRADTVSGPRLLSAGARFTVGMKQYGLPYKITSTVTAFEADKLLEWQHPLKHRWRWELEEIEPGVTRVTETFDYSRSGTPRMLEILGYPGKNGSGITKTLQGLQARFG